MGTKTDIMDIGTGGAAGAGRGTASMHAGIDVGSTTIKVVVLDRSGAVVHSRYHRHHSDVRAALAALVEGAAAVFGDEPMSVAVTGSGGLLLARWLDLPFVQEVVASKTAVEACIPRTDVAIELGGEDAKIIYFDHGVEQRMNGTCAGGTGAFIDQMATLLDTDAAGLDALAAGHRVIYPVASRCGVFAKSDVQPLLNEGARREDVAASILQSVVTQTISGLACGRPIRGHVAFLGGPLQHLPRLRERFVETLALDAEHTIVPPDAHLFVARGAALAGWDGPPASLAEVSRRLAALGAVQGGEVVRLPPLFADAGELAAFRARHGAERAPRGELASYRGTAYLGIDAGSTTLKSVLIGRDGEVLHDWYDVNNGDVVGTARTMMADLYAHLPVGPDGEPLVEIGHTTVTGYGEGLLVEALCAELEKIRERGYSVDDEEYVEGLYCMAAPVRSSSGQIVAAMSVAVPLLGRGTQFRRKRESILPRLIAAANGVSAALGWRGQVFS